MPLNYALVQKCSYYLPNSLLSTYYLHRQLIIFWTFSFFFSLIIRFQIFSKTARQVFIEHTKSILKIIIVFEHLCLLIIGYRFFVKWHFYDLRIIHKRPTIMCVSFSSFNKLWTLKYRQKRVLLSAFFKRIRSFFYKNWFFSFCMERTTANFTEIIATNLVRYRFENNLVGSSKMQNNYADCKSFNILTIGLSVLYMIILMIQTIIFISISLLLFSYLSYQYLYLNF